MQIHSHETLAGVPMLRVRELMRLLRQPFARMAVAHIAENLQIAQGQVAGVVNELLRQGFITQDERKGRDQETYYVLGNNGCRLASANAMRPLKRATAARILREFEERIEPINENPYYLYRIPRVVLFGSYLSDAPTIGDIDLIVHLEQKEPDFERHKELCIDRNFDYVDRGWNLDVMTMYGNVLPRREVFVALRKRSAYLSLHTYQDELVIENQPHQVIYGPEDYMIPDSVREIYGFDDTKELL